MIGTKALVALSAALPAINALGCYGNGGVLGALLGKGDAGFEFGNLHQDPRNFNSLKPDDLTGEILSDISTTCQMIQGYLVPAGKSWDHCSEWAAWKEDTDCKLIKCPSQCDNNNDNNCITDCAAACKDLRCDPLYGDSNHIDWAIKHDGNGDDTRTITYDVCYNAFKTEMEGCAHGSEQNYDGFWFRIDPNPRNCGK